MFPQVLRPLLRAAQGLWTCRLSAIRLNHPGQARRRLVRLWSAVSKCGSWRTQAARTFCARYVRMNMRTTAGAHWAYSPQEHLMTKTLRQPAWRAGTSTVDPRSATSWSAIRHSTTRLWIASLPVCVHSGRSSAQPFMEGQFLRWVSPGSGQHRLVSFAHL